MVYFLSEYLLANFRGEKGGNFMIDPGRHLASLRHWLQKTLGFDESEGKAT